MQILVFLDKFAIIIYGENWENRNARLKTLGRILLDFSYNLTGCNTTSVVTYINIVTYLTQIIMKIT